MDKNHTLIIEQIYSERNRYLQENYLEINHNNDAQFEINKFLWLHDLGIISDKELVVIKEEFEVECVAIHI